MRFAIVVVPVSLFLATAATAAAQEWTWGRGNRRPGHSPETDVAVSEALDWLARHQSQDGRWDCDGWPDRCGEAGCANGPEPDRGQPMWDVGVTSLALLAFVGSGDPSVATVHSATVSRGLRWLCTQQARDGSMGREWRDGRTVCNDGELIYNHALATYAMCQALRWGATLEREPCQRAVQFCLEAQNPGLGWKYGVRPGRNDTSVTTWMVLALSAAVEVGIEVPEAAFDGARSWLVRVTDGQGRGGYETPGVGSSFFDQNRRRYDRTECMTAAVFLSRTASGERLSWTDVLSRAIQKLPRPALVSAGASSNRPFATVNYCYWYFGTYALALCVGPRVQRSVRTDDAARLWNEWSESLTEALVRRAPFTTNGRASRLRRDVGCARGSWDPVDEWSVAGGRVYATALNALTLEVYDRYLPKAPDRRPR